MAAYRSLRLRALRESLDAFASTYEREATRSDDDWESRVSAVATSTSAQAFFAFQHAEPCGLVWCKSSEAESVVVEVFQMWVDPVSRGVGAGRALMARAIAWAEDRGAQRIRLGVTIQIPRRCAFICQAGFVTSACWNLCAKVLL